jgi:hypothetical protein
MEWILIVGFGVVVLIGFVIYASELNNGEQNRGRHFVQIGVATNRAIAGRHRSERARLHAPPAGSIPERMSARTRTGYVPESITGFYVPGSHKKR